MTYLAWSSFSEGKSDRQYLEVILPRVLEEILLKDGRRPTVVAPFPAVPIGEANRGVEAVAREICEKREAFHLLFIHSDLGGTNLSSTVHKRTIAYAQMANEICDFPVEHCVYLTPRHEIEAWVLADTTAVLQAMGVRGDGADYGLPAGGAAAEDLTDPKATLEQILTKVRGRRRRGRSAIPYAAIAQRQSLAALRTAPTFQQFENNLRRVLGEIGFLPLQSA